MKLRSFLRRVRRSWHGAQEGARLSWTVSEGSNAVIVVVPASKEMLQDVNGIAAAIIANDAYSVAYNTVYDWQKERGYGAR